MGAGGGQGGSISHTAGLITPYSGLSRGEAGNRTWRAEARWPLTSPSNSKQVATQEKTTAVVSHFISSSFAGLHRADFSQCATIVGCHVVWPESRKAATRLLRCAPALWVTQSRPHDEGAPMAASKLPAMG